MTGSICVESVFVGLKSCSGTRPCVNFSTPLKRAKKAVPPPPSPPPLVRAPGRWDSPEEDQAVSANDMLVTSSELMRLSQCLVDEVGNRTSQTIRTGMLSFQFLMVGPLFCLVLIVILFSLGVY